MSSRKPSRRPTASRHRRKSARVPRPVGIAGGGQGGFMGGPSAGGLQ